MAFRFSKRIGFGLLSINLSKGGVSVSAGPRGAKVNVDLSGRRNPRASLSIPGTGLSYVTELKTSAPSPAILDRLTPRHRLFVTVKDRSLPLKERAMATREVLRSYGDEKMAGTVGLLYCADQVLRGDGASLEERLRSCATLILSEGVISDGREYSVETIMETVRNDFAEIAAQNDVGEPLDTSPFEFPESRPSLWQRLFG